MTVSALPEKRYERLLLREGQPRHTSWDGRWVYELEARGAGTQRCDEHVAGAAGVLADDDRRPGRGQLVSGRPAKGVCQRRLEIDVGDAPDAVRAEEARHARAMPRATRRVTPTQP